MNKRFSKFMLTSASALALLAAYPSVVSTAEVVGFDLPAITAQAATQGDAFIRVVRALPSVSNIKASDASSVRAARTLYNSLSNAEKADANVKRWAGYLADKEAALPVDHVRDFLLESRALPNVAEINAMNAAEFAKAKVDLQAARSSYAKLTDAQKARTDVARWAGYLTVKEDAFGVTFILAAKDLPSMDAIGKLDAEELVAVQEDIDSVRELYDALSDVAKADTEVARWIGYVDDKEEAAQGEDVVEDEELVVESVSAINPTTLKIQFVGEVTEFDINTLSAEGLEFDTARVEGNAVYVTVKGATFNSEYNIVIEEQGEYNVKFGTVNDFYRLVIESDATDSDSNTIPDIAADGSSTMMLTAKVYDLEGNQVKDVTGTVKFEVTTGGVSQNDIVLQNGQAAVQLNSVSSADRTVYSTVTAQVVGQSDLAGLLGELRVEFIPKDAEGAVETAVPVVKAQTETADRVTVVLGQARPNLSAKQLESIKDAITLTDSVRGKVSVKEVRQLNDKLLEVVVDSYNILPGVNYLTDNAEHKIEFEAVSNLLVKSEQTFKLTDSTKQYALKADGINQRTIEVTFENPVSTKDISSALLVDNYVLDGKALAAGTKIDLKRDAKGNVVNEGKVVVIKLSAADAIKEEQVVLQVRNVGDWAAVTDPVNRISTQDLFLTTEIDNSIPKLSAVRQSPEQFLLSFDKPVTIVGNKTLSEIFDVRYGDKEATADGADGTGYKKGDLINSLNAKVNFTKLDEKGNEVVGDEFSQVLVELTEDWTVILKDKAFWVDASKIQFKAPKNAFQTVLGNRSLAIDERVANPQDYTSPTIVGFVQDTKTTNNKEELLATARVTFSEPVQLDDDLQGSGIVVTQNKNQDKKIVVEFSKGGNVVQGELLNPRIQDYVLTVQPKASGGKEGFDVLKAAFDKEQDAVGEWKVTVTGVADDYGNTMATQAFTFVVPGEQAVDAKPLPIKPFVTFAQYEKNADGEDVITVKFSEIMANKDAAGVGLVGNYILNSTKLSDVAGAKIEKGIKGVTNDWDGITITLPKGSVVNPTFMLTLPTNFKSADDQQLEGVNKLNFVQKNVVVKSEYLPKLVFTNSEAVEVKKFDGIIVGGSTTATEITDGEVTKLEVNVEFSKAYGSIFGNPLQVEVNNKPVGTFSSGNELEFTLDGDKVKALKLAEGDRVEVKINGQTVHVGTATPQ